VLASSIFFVSSIRVHTPCGACGATNSQVLDPGSTPGRRSRFTTLLSHDLGVGARFPRLPSIVRCEIKRLDVEIDFKLPSPFNALELFTGSW